MPAGDPRRPGFVSLSELLRARTDVAQPVPEASAARGAEPPAADACAGESPAPAGAGVAESAEQGAAIRAARLFGATLADAFDALVVQLTRDLAVEVLMRELQLAPADVAMLAQRLLGERCAQGPLRLRVAAADAHIVCDLPVATDDRLEPGDAVLECQSGEIDARLAVRLAAVVARLTP